MTAKDAYMFPVMGSAVLFSLYLLFKFLDKELVNMLLTLCVAQLPRAFPPRASLCLLAHLLTPPQLLPRVWLLRALTDPRHSSAQARAAS
jgi:minor histocompatibility antigen H13